MASLSIEDIAREAQRLRVPMSHTTRDPEYVPVLAYRIDQSIASAEARLEALKALRHDVATRARVDEYLAR